MNNLVGEGVKGPYKALLQCGAAAMGNSVAASQLVFIWKATHSFLHIYLKELQMLKQEGVHKFRSGYSFSPTTQAGGSLCQPGL